MVKYQRFECWGLEHDWDRYGRGTRGSAREPKKKSISKGIKEGRKEGKNKRKIRGEGEEEKVERRVRECGWYTLSSLLLAVAAIVVGTPLGEMEKYVIVVFAVGIRQVVVVVVVVVVVRVVAQIVVKGGKGGGSGGGLMWLNLVFPLVFVFTFPGSNW